MHQVQMFSNTIAGAEYLGGGINAAVHSLPDGWVMKVARGRDGTLNWLGFCKFMQDTGQHMRGMPVIDRLTLTDNDGYVCTMRQYTPITGVDWQGGIGAARYEYPYLDDLVAAYVAYANANFHRRSWVPSSGFEMYILFSDCHHGNVMRDSAGDWVITDPDSGCYWPPILEHNGPLVLH